MPEKNLIEEHFCIVLGKFPLIFGPDGLFWQPCFSYFNAQWPNGDGLGIEGRKGGGPAAAKATQTDLKCRGVDSVTSETSAPTATQPAKRPAISFEFFPPKTEEMERNLWDTITRLAPLTPNFVSVTYGAGGSTRERTHSTISRILSETSLTPAAHLTCVDAARADINDVVDRYHEVGVRHIVALRGDPMSGIGSAYIA